MNHRYPYITIAAILTAAVSFHGCDAFASSKFVRPPSQFSSTTSSRPRTTTILEVAASADWFSSATSDSSFWSSKSEPASTNSVPRDEEDEQLQLAQQQLTAITAEQQQQLLRNDVYSSDNVRTEQDVVGKKGKIRAQVKETGYDSMRSYIKTMCNHELLNRNEEVVLAREIQVLIKWEEQREELETQLLRYVYIMHPIRPTHCKSGFSVRTVYSSFLFSDAIYHHHTDLPRTRNGLPPFVPI